MNKLLLSSFFCSFILIFSADVAANQIEFNTDLLDVKDKESIDSGIFKSTGYIMPGDYFMQVIVNDQLIGERNVSFIEKGNGKSEFCLNTNIIDELGLTTDKRDMLKKAMIENCYDLNVLPGVVVKASVSTDTLSISIPQAYRDYSNSNWDPPTRWEDGINGAILDYSLNLQHGRTGKNDSKLSSFSGYGVTGVNIGSWRLRADWQGRYEESSSETVVNDDSSDIEFNRVYAYRALKDQQAKLALGELDLGSSMFDSFQFTGVSVVSEEDMLPPSLRGYAPEVVGIARTNAKVVISQQGRVIYETQVAAGPFRIQDLNSGTTGSLDVKVEESDGSIQQFQVNTANIPYLSRPGSVRFKLNSGRANSSTHNANGPAFASGEFSWGIDNGWSLLGGVLFGDGYSALSSGIGRDLLSFGAVSFDVTRSQAELEGGIKRGNSFRINYSKSFDDYDSQVAFAGYRFSERNFMTMGDYLAAKDVSNRYFGSSKEMYTTVFSKQFRNSNLSAYLDYTYQSYWDRPDSDRISVSLSHYFDFWDWKGLTGSFTAFQNKRSDIKDNGVYFSLSVPFGGDSHISYNASAVSKSTSHSMTYFDRLDDRNSYSLTAISANSGDGVSGFYNHLGDTSTMVSNVSYQSNGDLSAGLSVVGGVTATAEGAAMHRVGMMGGGRILIDTDDVSNVPVQSNGPSVKSNFAGKAVVADVSGYYRQKASVDIDDLDGTAEPLGSPIKSMTLTEGAIGYRHFDILSGSKRMVSIKFKGANLPFASEVFNSKGQRLGMLADDGLGYLVGLHSGDKLKVIWGHKSCSTELPLPLPSEESVIKLTCR